MLIDTYFFELASLAKLHGHHIDPPRALRTGMKVQVIGCHLQYLMTFVDGYRIFGKTIGDSPTSFDFYKDQIVFIFGHKVNLSITATKVALQNVISFTQQ